MLVDDTCDSQAYENDELSVKFLNDPVAQEKLANTKKLSDIDASQYDVVFYVGGHGPVIDLAFDEVNATLASDVSNLRGWLGGIYLRVA